MNRFALLALVLASTLVVGACGVLLKARSAEARRPQEEGPTDPEIVDVVLAAARGEASIAALGVARTSRDDVRTLLRELDQDHGAHLVRAGDVAVAKGLVVVVGEPGRRVRARTQDALRRLDGEPPAAFDRALLIEDARAHEAALRAYDELAAIARDPQVAALVRDVRAREAVHLSRLRDLVASLAGPGGGTAAGRSEPSPL